MLISIVLILCAYGVYVGQAYYCYALIETPGYYVHQWNLKLGQLIPTSYVRFPSKESHGQSKANFFPECPPYRIVLPNRAPSPKDRHSPRVAAHPGTPGQPPQVTILVGMRFHHRATVCLGRRLRHSSERAVQPARGHLAGLHAARTVFQPGARTAHEWRGSTVQRRGHAGAPPKDYLELEPQLAEEAGCECRFWPRYFVRLPYLLFRML